MLSSWHSVAFLLILLLILVEFRLLGGRLTISVGRLLMFFGFGATGAVVGSILVERLAEIPLDVETIVYTVGPPFEQALQALPLFLLAFVFAGGRRLTIADYTLIGIATGLGFQLIEDNFLVVISQEVPPNLLDGGISSSVVQGLHLSDSAPFAAGHALWTGLVGLGVGVGLRVWPEDWRRLVPGVLAFLIVSFEHALYNWKLDHVKAAGTGDGRFKDASDLVEKLYSVDLQGRLSVALLIGGLIAATIAEGLWVRRRMRDRQDLRLPGEDRRPFFLTEYLLLLRRLPLGRAEFVRTAHYLRRRRELALTDAESLYRLGMRVPARHLAGVVTEERTELDTPLPARWLPASGELGAVIRRRWMVIVGVAVAIVFLAFVPEKLPDGISDLLFGRFMAAVLIALGGALLWVRVREFRESPPPPLNQTDGEALATHHAQAVLLWTSAGSLVLGVVAWFLSQETLVPGADASAYITDNLNAWVGAGGNLQTLLPAAAILAAGIAEPMRRVDAAAAAEVELAAPEPERAPMPEELAEPEPERLAYVPHRPEPQAEDPAQEATTEDMPAVGPEPVPEEAVPETPQEETVEQPEATRDEPKDLPTGEPDAEPEPEAPAPEAEVSEEELPAIAEISALIEELRADTQEPEPLELEPSRWGRAGAAGQSRAGARALAGRGG